MTPVWDEARNLRLDYLNALLGEALNGVTGCPPMRPLRPQSALAFFRESEDPHAAP